MVFGIDHHFLYYLNILIRAALIGFQLDTLQYLRCTPNFKDNCGFTINAR